MDPEASLVPGAVPPQSWRAGDLHPHQHRQQQQQLLLQNQHQQQLQNQHQQQLQQQQQHQQHQQQHQLRHPQHLPQQQPYQRMGKQLPQKLWLQRQQLRLQQQQQSQQKAHHPHQQNLQYQLLQQHERKHRQHHEHHEHREPHEAQSQSSPPAIQSSSSATAQSAAATAAGRSGGASFAISSAHGAVQKSVFRSLHGEADGGEAQTPASTAATPKTVMAAAVTDRDRPQPPLCSSRGRVPFGDCTWMIEAALKDGEGTAAAAAAASGSIPSSPAGPSAISSSNGSLRTAVFKQPGAMLYAGGGNSSGTPLPASPSQPTSESVDKSSGGRPKPWRIEVPANIPHYIVPPPGRRFGGLAKTAGTGSSTAAAGRGYGQPVGTAGRSGTAAGRIQKSGTAGGGGISSGTAGPVVRYMDFNPWRGRCTEDRLNDTTVRNGNYDRVQSSQALTAETSTARGAWLPTALRRNNSTPMLAQLLALANALARERSQIAPGSQFKLPPRVTVTDTRRETWLRDLTNAAIPLRKLSRTIPHGLRGRVLLDQCAQKAVPVDRAMWLARCVGAQELRAFKRKGAASVATLAEAELRWLKDWTLTAQLFLDGALAELDLAGGDQEGDQGGRERLQYGARFVRQLYVERLLDHEQFLYWMLSGLRNAVRPPSAVDPTPYFGLWLFVIEAYFDDIMQRRRAACHLAMTLLGRLEQLEHHQLLHPGASSPTLALIQPKKMLQRIVRGHADTFVCQAVWPRCEQLLAKVLAASTNTDSPTSTSTPSDPDTYTYSLRHAAALSLIRRRNAALRPEMSVEMEQAIHMLLPLDDAIRHAVDFAAHFADFVRLDQAEAVPFVVRWCASIHRPGLAKVYVAARLIGELCGNDARLVTDHVLAFLSSDRRDKTEVPKTGQKPNTSANQRRLHVLHDRQHEGNKALYQLVGLLTERGLFVPGNYLALLILQSRPSDPAEIVSNGRPQVRLAAELPVALLDRPTSNLRANTLRRLGYDTAFEADDLNGILQEVEAVLEEQANHEQTDDTTMKDAPTSSLRPHMSFPLLARCVEERSRNVKMAVAAWLDGHVVTPMQAAATTSPMALERVDAVQTLIEKTDDLGLLARFLLALTRSPQSLAVLAMCADTTSLHLAAFVALGQARQLYDQVMSRALAATVAVDVGTSTTFQTMLRPGTDLRPLLLALPALADKMLPPSAPGSLVLGVEGQPLRLVAKNAAAAAAGSITQQPTGTDISQRHYEAGPEMAAGLQRRLAEMDQRLCVATYDADCSPVSDGQPQQPMHQHQQQQQHQGDAAADEVRDEMVKIAMSSTGSIDGATMDRLFGTIAMITQEKWRHLGSGNGSTTSTNSNATDHLRLSASLFARLRRLNQTHFDMIMVKWLKRLRMLRDRPAVAIIYPVFVVFGCLDLASLLATTADEQPREPGGPVQSPARNTWRTSYLQDVLALLSAPLADRGSGSSCNATLTCDENQRFRLFLSEAPFAAPAAIAALVRNAVAEMTQWRRQQNMTTAAGHHAAPRSSVDALAVSRLLRTAAVADATAAAHALARTTDQAVRRGLWEMTTLALTRQVVPARPALDMLRELDIFAADMGQLALGLAVWSPPSSPSSSSSLAGGAPSGVVGGSPAAAFSPNPWVSEADGLAGLILRAVAESQLPSLHVLHSLPSDMAVSLKEHAQARFLDLVPTRKQPLRDAQHVCVATGFLDVVRTIMLSQQLQQKRQKQRPRSQPPAPPPLLLSPAIQSAAGLPALDSAVVDKLGELWCLLQEHKTSTAAAMATRQSIIQDWLPALLSLVLLHLPSRGLTTADGLGPSLPRTSRDLDQETVSAGACIVLASLCIDIVPLADDPADGNSSGRLALQTRLFDTALLLADGLSDETRQSCVRTLRDVSASVAVPNTVGAGDLSPAMAYLLSSPASASIYYPRLYLERMPAMFGRPGPQQQQQQQQQSGTSSQPTTGAVRRLAGFAAPPERSRRVRFGLKTWDAVSDPSPAVQDNDTAVNLWLLEATKVVRQRRR